MEALRIKGEVVLADPQQICEQDVELNLRLVSDDISSPVTRRQVVLVALAFSYPNAAQPA